MKKYIILEGPKGKRKVEENVEYRLLPGESVVGPDVDNTRNTSPETSVLSKLASYFGMELADFIRSAAVILNRSGLVKIDLNCKMCDLRYKVLYSIKQLGILKCTILIARSLRGKLSQEDEKQIEESFDGPTNHVHR